MAVNRGKKDSSNWKDHPVIIVIIAGAAVAAFMMSVVFPMLTTIQSQKLEAALQRSQRDKDAIENLKGSLKVASLSLKTAARELASRGEELRSLRLGAMFDPMSPLPYGWRSVPIGSEKSLIRTRYPDRKIEDDGEGMVRVSSDQSPFDAGIFYISENGLVKFIRFSHYKLDFVNGELISANKGVVTRKLRDSFGEPDLVKKDSLCWLGRNGVDLVQDKFALMILPASKYVLNECGSEAEVMAARFKSLNCPVPKELQKIISD